MCWNVEIPLHSSGSPCRISSKTIAKVFNSASPLLLLRSLIGVDGWRTGPLELFSDYLPLSRHTMKRICRVMNSVAERDSRLKDESDKCSRKRGSLSIFDRSIGSSEKFHDQLPIGPELWPLQFEFSGKFTSARFATITPSPEF